MNTLLISTAASDNTVAHKPATSHVRSERDSDADQTPAFADVFVSQVAPQQQHSGTATQGGSDTVRPKEDAASRNSSPHAAGISKAENDHRGADSHHNAEITHRAQMLGTGSALTASDQNLDSDVKIGNHPRSGSSLSAAGDVDANATLPNRFSQVIAALPKASADANNKDANRNAATERSLSVSSNIKIDKFAPDQLNANHKHRNAWQHQTRMATHGAATRASNSTPPATAANKGTARALSPVVDAAAFGQFMPQDTVSGRHDLSAVQTMASSFDVPTSHGVTPMVTPGPVSDAAQSADSLFSTAHIDRPLNGTQWGAEFGRQFISLIRPGENGSHQVELRLDPPELGPLRVTINISDTVVQAMFTSSHSTVRNAVEQALPQLQQQLEQEGLSLGQTSVGHGDGGSDSDFGNTTHHARGVAQSDGSERDITNTAPVRPRISDALIDTFA